MAGSAAPAWLGELPRTLILPRVSAGWPGDGWTDGTPAEGHACRHAYRYAYGCAYAWGHAYGYAYAGGRVQHS